MISPDISHECSPLRWATSCKHEVAPLLLIKNRMKLGKQHGLAGYTHTAASPIGGTFFFDFKITSSTYFVNPNISVCSAVYHELATYAKCGLLFFMILIQIITCEAGRLRSKVMVSVVTTSGAKSGCKVGGRANAAMVCKGEQNGYCLHSEFKI